MSIDKKEKGYAGEALVLEYYLDDGYILVTKNFTIRGGEIDLVVENERNRVFVEVKVVDAIDDYAGYITKKKLLALKKTVMTFTYRYPTYKTSLIDVVFVEQNRIVSTFANITL